MKCNPGRFDFCQPNFRMELANIVNLSTRAFNLLYGTDFIWIHFFRSSSFPESGYMVIE